MLERPEAEDDVEIEFDSDTMEPIVDEEEPPVDMSFGANLADFLDDSLCNQIGSERQEQLVALKGARENWERGIERGIQWLGLSTNPAGQGDDNLCNAVHPLLMENIVKFQAKAIQELWPAKGPVRTKVKGYVNPDREKAAARVRNYMNYQLTERIPGFYADLERNLFRVGFMGIGIRKSGWNGGNGEEGAPDPTIVFAENFYVDPAVSHLRQAEEHIEVIEMSCRIMDSYLRDNKFRPAGEGDDPEIELNPSEIAEAIASAQGFDTIPQRMGYRVGESHVYLDLCGDDPLLPEGGFAPYIVHFNVDTGGVYAIRRNWREGDPAMNKKEWYTVDSLIPGFGFYPFGFVHLIGDLAASSSATLRALVDSGSFNNWQGGFKSKDAKFSNSDSPLDFGEFRDVDLSPEDLQRAFLPLPAKEPSQVLFMLLEYMVKAGQKFADTTDEVVANGTNYGPAATTLALLEASGRFYSSIHKRLHQSQHEFFRLLGELNRDNLPTVVKFVVGSENEVVHATDFDPNIVDVIPASDPNALSETQRVAKAQIELEMAARFPQQHDMSEALRRFYLAMGTDDLDKLMPNKEAMGLSADPLTEIQAAMAGKPIKAQLGQDHQSHIAVKQAFLASPQMQGVNDSMVATGLALINANMNEHRVLMFAAQIMQAAQQMGLPPQAEQVQGAIAAKMLEVSAASGPGLQPSTEQQMIDLNKQELAVAQKRLDSQDARENAKIAQKDRELDLKAIQIMNDTRNDEANRSMDAAFKLLDKSTQDADTALNALSSRVPQPQ